MEIRDAMIDFVIGWDEDMQVPEGDPPKFDPEDPDAGWKLHCAERKVFRDLATTLEVQMVDHGHHTDDTLACRITSLHTFQDIARVWDRIARESGGSGGSRIYLEDGFWAADFNLSVGPYETRQEFPWAEGSGDDGTLTAWVLEHLPEAVRQDGLVLGGSEPVSIQDRHGVSFEVRPQDALLPEDPYDWWRLTPEDRGRTWVQVWGTRNGYGGRDLLRRLHLEDEAWQDLQRRLPRGAWVERD